MTEPPYTGTGTDFYLAAPELAEMVNLAVYLGRPILVEGEPGCGKTKLADSIAAEKGLGEPIKISVKSTSRAQDLLYRVNAMRRIQDAQNPHMIQARFTWPYITLEPLGFAIQSGQRRVVLIDEIDKADIDFPNDLLDVLDNFRFQIDELPESEDADCRAETGFGRVVVGNPESRPIIVITSNREKRLPEPFLRRCLYLRIKFPAEFQTLREIVRQNTKIAPSEWNDEILGAAVAAFQRVRRVAVAGNLQKPPTTGELIDWAKVLFWRQVSHEAIGKDPLRPPYWETLFKTMSDLEAYPTLAKAQQKKAAT